MQRPSAVTVVLLAAALALAGNMATNAVQLENSWWPFAIWAVVALLVVAMIIVESTRDRGGVSVSPVRKLNDPIQLGVHPAAMAKGSRIPPFVPRDRLPDLEKALRAGGFILVVGDSTAGKTRLAYEAMRATFPHHHCVRPLTPDTLPAAFAVARRKRRAVLWLDDLERYVGFRGLNVATLPQCVVLATMRTHERDDLSVRYDPFRAAGERQSARAGREVLNAVTTEIRLDRMWSSQELTLAHASGDERIMRALRSSDLHGIAETVAAGPQLLQEWRDGRNVRGAAIVSAAVDARRAGYHRPLPVELLRTLHETYLRAGFRPGSWDEALAWATQPLHATSSLLEPVHDEGLLAFDYLVDQAANASDSPPIPTATWNTLITQAQPAEVVEVAWQASFHGHLDQIERAFHKALDADQFSVAASIAACLGYAGREQLAADLLELTISRATGSVTPAELLTLRHALAWEIGNKIGDRGDPERALQIARELVADSLALHGEDHPNTLHTQVTLARQLGATGQHQQALTLATAISNRAASVHGSNARITLSARFEAAVWTRAVHGPAAAAAQFRELLQQAQSTPIADGGLVITCMWNLGGALIDSGDPAAAVEVLTDAIRESKLAYGEHHKTLLVRYAHAHAVGEAGNHTTALDLARRLADDCARILGTDHQTTMEAQALTDRWS